MTDEQKTRIPLDSPLDISSQNMLVPVGQPKFTYNRQKYLGSLLQTSVRYEDDGWFAGWLGHTFEQDTDAHDLVIPKFDSVPTEDAPEDPYLVILPRETTTGHDYYILRHRKEGIVLLFTFEWWREWTEGKLLPTGFTDAYSPNDVTLPAVSSGYYDLKPYLIDPDTGDITDDPNPDYAYIYRMTRKEGILDTDDRENLVVVFGETVKYDDPSLVGEKFSIVIDLYENELRSENYGPNSSDLKAVVSDDGDLYILHVYPDLISEENYIRIRVNDVEPILIGNMQLKYSRPSSSPYNYSTWTTDQLTDNLLIFKLNDDQNNAKALTIDGGTVAIDGSTVDIDLIWSKFTINYTKSYWDNPIDPNETVLDPNDKADIRYKANITQETDITASVSFELEPRWVKGQFLNSEAKTPGIMGITASQDDLVQSDLSLLAGYNRQVVEPFSNTTYDYSTQPNIAYIHKIPIWICFNTYWSSTIVTDTVSFQPADKTITLSSTSIGLVDTILTNYNNIVRCNKYVPVSASNPKPKWLNIIVESYFAEYESVHPEPWDEGRYRLPDDGKIPYLALHEAVFPVNTDSKNYGIVQETMVNWTSHSDRLIIWTKLKTDNINKDTLKNWPFGDATILRLGFTVVGMYLRYTINSDGTATAISMYPWITGIQVIFDYSKIYPNIGLLSLGILPDRVDLPNGLAFRLPDKARTRISIPFSVWGAVSRYVYANDIFKSNKDAFSTSDIIYNTRVGNPFLLTDASSDEYDCSLKCADFKIVNAAALNQERPNDITVQVSIEVKSVEDRTTGNTNPAVFWASESNASFIWPEFIFEDDKGNFIDRLLPSNRLNTDNPGTRDMISYIPSDDTNITALLSLKVNINNYIRPNSANYIMALVKQNIYNSELNDILPDLDITINEGNINTDQVLYIKINKIAILSSIKFKPDSRTGNIVATGSSTIGLFNTFKFDEDSDLSKEDTLVGILSFKYTYTDNWFFYHTFILDKQGLMNVPGLTIVGQNIEGVLNEVEIELKQLPQNISYGKVDLLSGYFTDAKMVMWARTDLDQVFPKTLKILVVENRQAKLEYIPIGIYARNNNNVKYLGSGDDAEITPLNPPEVPDDYKQYNYKYLDILYKDDFKRIFVDVSEGIQVFLDYWVTDIRNNQPKKIYTRNIKDIDMYVKQFWASTVDIENFWWLDAKHVLELSKDTITLYSKEDTVSDWNGNNWTIPVVDILTTIDDDTGAYEYRAYKQQVPRSLWLTTDDLYYGMSCAYNIADDKDLNAVFFKLQATETAIVVKYIAEMTPDEGVSSITNIAWVTKAIRVKQAKFGNQLSTRQIESYLPINPADLIVSSRISATALIDIQTKTHDNASIFVLGIAHSRGLQQWTLVFNKNSGNLITIINGYGHVGLNGSLTGGQIPINCCSVNEGFNQAVQELKKLPETGALKPGCYGNGSQVWFIYERIEGIVSHFEYVMDDNGNFNFQPIELLLNNNVETKYISTSFKVSGLFDVLPESLTLEKLFTSNNKILQVTSKIAEVVLPNLFYINMSLSYLHYINHSLGQYAYVYHNSLREVIEDNKTDTDILFCKSTEKDYHVTYAQEQNNKIFWIDIILKGVVSTVADPIPYKVNEAQNQTTGEQGKGKNWSPFFLDNLASTINSSLLTSGMLTSISSTLKAEYSLSMFYSISEKSQCWAGPGFVNHNFVAQCKAQSITDLQADGKKYGYFATLKGLSLALGQIKYEATRLVYELLEKMAEQIAGTPTGAFGVGSGVIVPLGIFVALAIAATKLTMKLLLIAQKVMLDSVIPAIADAMGGSVGTTFSTGVVQKRSLQMEPQHAYGDKAMSFFWPVFGIVDAVSYTNESVTSDYEKNEQEVNLAGKKLFKGVGSFDGILYSDGHHGTDTSTLNDAYRKGGTILKGPITNVHVSCKGEHTEVRAPYNMAVVEGVTALLPQDSFKDEQVGSSLPVFPPPPIHDYKIDDMWRLSFTATNGLIMWVSQDDTKLIDGPPSNIVVFGTSFCGIASPYTVIEVKDVFDEDYLRPIAITPNAIALNLNRINCVHEGKAYHAFDGYGNRIISWRGGVGMDRSHLYQQYAYQVNDHFKRSNILPPSEFMGFFQGPPNLALRAYDRVANHIQSLGNEQGLGNPIPGEDKDLRRYSIPVFSEPISTLPAMVRMLGPYKLAVVDGVTSLVTEIRNMQPLYKAPSSVDFNINGIPFRSTAEYISSIQTRSGAVIMDNIVPIAGMTFIGATTKEAFFYSPATRMYYSFSSNRDLTKRDVFNRFHDIIDGRWDFVNQEVIFKCLLGKEVLVCRLDGNVLGEVYPPNETIFNKRSGFKVLSMAGGLTYQGPKRFAVNRFITNEHMYYSIRFNKDDNKWTHKLSREEFWAERDYGWHYEDWYTVTDQYAAMGWTHNPFKLATAMLGIDEKTDAKFEWELTFAWTDQMEALYRPDEYVTVNIQAETITQGGVVLSPVTRIYLFKECFTRSGNFGYYTFQFQSNNGIGNRERLYVWSDGIIALEDLQVSTKQMTTHRMNPAFTQLDIKDLKEF